MTLSKRSLRIAACVLALLLAAAFCSCGKQPQSKKITVRTQTESESDTGSGTEVFSDDRDSVSEETESSTAPETAGPAAREEEEAGKSVADQPAADGSDALRSARNYLDFSAFSYDGLIGQLEYEGYSHDEAVYAADNCGADWFEQAVKSAEAYLKYSSFSYDGLVEQLEFEGFTHEQAVYGADKTYAPSSSSGNSAGQENALDAAKDYLTFSAFSYSGLIDQLEFEGYSHDDAVYAADNCGADWFEQAARSAKSYLEAFSFSGAELIDQLEYEGFTYEQAVYGAKQNGY